MMRAEMAGRKTKKVNESEANNEVVSLREDLMVLTKIRLNTFVLITTLFGYILASKSLHNAWIDDWWMLFHTILGTAAAAFGSAAFNQLMEIQQDKQNDCDLCVYLHSNEA